MTYPIPEGLNITIGMPLIYNPTGEAFKVLCSCPSSKPKHFTRRFVMANRTMYSIPEVLLKAANAAVAQGWVKGTNQQEQQA